MGARRKLVESEENLILKRGLPANIEAERLILGSFQLQGRDAFDKYAGALSVESFALEKHRRIFTRMAELHSDGEEIDRVTVADILLKYQELESVDGLTYLVSLDDGLPQLARLDSYVNILRKKAALRRLAEVGKQAMNRALLGDEEPLAIAEELETAANECRVASLGKSGFSTFTEVVRAAGGLDNFLARGSGIAIPYPWEGLNRLTRGGMRPGHLIVIAGASGEGKSAWALNVALNVAQNAMKHAKGGAALFSLEMLGDEICERMLAMESGVNSYDFGRLMGQDRDRVRDAARRLSEIPLHINDNPRPTLGTMKSDLKRLTAREKIAVTVFDYLQLIEAKTGRKTSTRAEEVGVISRGLKLMMGEFSMPGIAVSQLSVEHLKQEREPELKDIRESGSIVNDSNLVLIIHFKERYDVQNGIMTGVCDLIAAKQRGGMKGRIRLEFHAPTGTFNEIMPGGSPGRLELVR